MPPAAHLPGRVLARFPHPEPRRGPRGRVLPVFLPYAGCPQRCLFCNQPAQTGTAPEPLEAIYARLAERLERELAPAALPRGAGTGPSAGAGRAATSFLSVSAAPAPGAASSEDSAPELAFYGGTFTALPAPWPQRFLELARPHLASGRLSRVRCSTRPDAVPPALLAELKGLGLSLVELGVQSFDDAALAASRRGYTGAQARQGCDAVRQAGLALGVQLMPGMPGQGRAAFRADAALAAGFAPELARLYPCLVLEGTALADLWRAGEHAPWDLEATVAELAPALLEFWAAGVRVARVGLAEQEGLEILAGPRHPALGQLARSRALLQHVERQAALLRGRGEKTGALLVPRRLQGEILGQRNMLVGEYAALGLAVTLWDEADLALCAGAG